MMFDRGECVPQASNLQFQYSSKPVFSTSICRHIPCLPRYLTSRIGRDRPSWAKLNKRMDQGSCSLLSSQVHIRFPLWDCYAEPGESFIGALAAEPGAVAGQSSYSEQLNSAYTTIVVQNRVNIRTAWEGKATKTLMNEACTVSW